MSTSTRSLTRQLASSLSCLLECTGVHVELLRMKSVSLAIDTIYGWLLEGFPVGAYVDVTALKHFPAKQRLRPSSHTIVIYGLDLSEGVAHIFDCYIPTLPPTHYQGCMSVTDLERGLSILLERHKTCLLFRAADYYDHELPPLNRACILRRLTSRLVGKDPKTGLSAIRQLASDINQWVDWWGQDTKEALDSIQD